MSKTSTNQFQKGLYILFRDNPCQIVDFQFVNPGKGSAFVKTKLKNIKTGAVIEFTFKSGEQVESVPVEVREMQYLYKSNDAFIFMDKENYEQSSLDKNSLGNFYQYLKEGEVYQILTHNGLAIGARFPKKVKLMVKIAEAGAKGNTVMGAKKMVTLETGIELAVPLFIKEGDVVAVDPETGEYLERVSQK